MGVYRVQSLGVSGFRGALVEVWRGVFGFRVYRLWVFMGLQQFFAFWIECLDFFGGACGCRRLRFP